MPRDGVKNRKKHENGQKQCQRCKEWKPLSEYFGDNSRWDRLSPRCKECGRAIQRQYPPGVGAKLRGIKRRQSYNNKGEKLCSSCGQWKVPEQFEKRNDVWDGRRAKCKECLNQLSREKYVKKGRPKKRGKYNMTVVGSAALSKAARERFTGSRNPNWKGGISWRSWRSTPEYLWWRRKVFGRDGFTCQHCSDSKGGNLTAHHIKTAKEFPNLVLDVDNGITLCEKCHSEVHGIPVRGSRYKETEMTVCACGCETSIKRWATPKSTRPRRYLPGHFIRIFHKRQYDENI